MEDLSIKDLRGSLILHEQRINGKLEDIPKKDTIEKARYSKKDTADAVKFERQ